MSARRTVRLQTINLVYPKTVGDSEAFAFGDGGHASFSVLVGGEESDWPWTIAPAVDGPTGGFHLYVSNDGQNYNLIDAADAELSKLDFAGAGIFSASASLDLAPNMYGKLVFIGTGGGSTTAHAWVWVTVG